MSSLLLLLFIGFRLFSALLFNVLETFPCDCTTCPHALTQGRHHQTLMGGGGGHRCSHVALVCYLNHELLELY